jgi:hypothetical protein
VIISNARKTPSREIKAQYNFCHLFYINFSPTIWIFKPIGLDIKVKYMYNNQLDALSILSLLNYHTSTRFGHINSPSSGGRMYIWQMVLVILLSWLSAGLGGMSSL